MNRQNKIVRHDDYITLFRMGQLPQLIRREIALCWKGMIVPQYIKVDLEPWDEGTVTEKHVQTVRRIKMSILFQLVQEVK